MPTLLTYSGLGLAGEYLKLNPQVEFEDKPNRQMQMCEWFSDKLDENINFTKDCCSVMKLCFI